MRRLEVRSISCAVIFGVAALCLAVGAEANEGVEVTIPVARAFTIESKVLGEERQVLVNLPRGYEDGEDRYPALIVLDGSPFMAIFAQLAQLDRDIPAFIVAAVPNVDRLRDLSHRNLAEIWPTSGGANAFLAFLTDELAPWLDTEFRTTGYRVITGNSAAGRYSTFALLEAPETFDAAIARSPALGTDYEMIEGLVERARAADIEGEHFLFIVYGSHDYPVVTAYAERLVRLLDNRAPSWLRYQREVIDNTGHFQFVGINAGLHALFAGNAFPTEGFLLEGPDAVAAHAQLLSARFKMDIQASDLTGERELIDSANDLGRQGRFTDAVRVLDYGLELRPESATTLYYMAQWLEHAGRTPEALAAYDRVFEMGPSSGIAGMTMMLRDNLAAREKTTAP
jgi:predicted alpha/beta superfamily hydrolase